MLLHMYYFRNILLILRTRVTRHGNNTQFFQKNFGKLSDRISN
jgi:hypothetical protein